MSNLTGQYLMRLEAVNIAHSVDDTRQLSVSRGGSLQIRAAPEGLPRFVEQINNSESNKLPIEVINSFKPVTTGASSGVYEFKSTAEDAIKLRKLVVDWLRNHPDYGNHSFVVDVEPAANLQKDFNTPHERVIAKNRFRQLQQPSLAFPSENPKNESPCSWDNLRPVSEALINAHDPDNRVRRLEGHTIPPLSTFTHIRHVYGREQKAQFFREECSTDSGPDEANHRFTWNLQEIASYHSLYSSANTEENPYGFLNNKLAIFYADGNGFGKIQQFLKNKESIAEFDSLIKNYRRNFLRQLVNAAAADPDFKTESRQKGLLVPEAIRLEILQWGGDELTIVVPAWRGMQTLQLFYKTMQPASFDGKKLTHSAGLVFFDARTPIHKMRHLAKEMADEIKLTLLNPDDDSSIDKYKDEANLYNILVLESVDYPTNSYRDFTTRRYKSLGRKKFFPLSPCDGTFKEKQQEFVKLQEEIPSRQLYKLANSAIMGDQFEHTVNRFNRVVLGNNLDRKNQLDHSIASFFPGVMSERMRWIYLAELWNYFAPVRNDKEHGYESA